MIKKIILLTIIIIPAFFVFSCGKNILNSGKGGRVLYNPEVKMIPEPGGITEAVLPEVPEIRWDFFKEEGKTELGCSFKMKVIYKEKGTFTTKVEFMDLNKFPVSSETFKISGEKGEEIVYERALYLDPSSSSRITKAQIIFTPTR